MHMVTRTPRHLSNRPSDEAVRPLPSDEDTPPVTKMYLVFGAVFGAVFTADWRVV